MRILYVGPFRFPDGDAAASRVLNNARMFRKLGHEVTILSFGGRYRDEDESGGEYFYDGLKYVITADIDTHSLKERFLRYTVPYSNCRKWMKGNMPSYDMVLTYNSTFAFNKWLIPFCKWNHRILACDITEWYAPDEMSGGKFSPIYWCSEWNMKHTQKKIHNKILISSYLSKLYPESNNIVLPPLVDLNDEKWRMCPGALDERIESHKGIRILYAGTPAKKDLLANLLNADICLMNKGIYDIQIIVAGVSESQVVDFVDERADFGRYRDNLIFLGRIPQEQVPAYYNISDFSAIIREPTRKNMAGFPTKMAESMASGCPVLVTLTSDLSDYVTDGENAVVIKDGTVGSILKAFDVILQMAPSERLMMKKKAFESARSGFDIDCYHESVMEWMKFID